MVQKQDKTLKNNDYISVEQFPIPPKGQGESQPRVIGIFGLNTRAIFQSRLKLCREFQKAGFRVVVFAPLVASKSLSKEQIRLINETIRTTFATHKIEWVHIPNAIHSVLFPCLRSQKVIHEGLASFHVTDILIFHQKMAALAESLLDKDAFRSMSIIMGVLNGLKNVGDFDTAQQTPYSSFIRRLVDSIQNVIVKRVSRIRQAKIISLLQNINNIIVQNQQDGDTLRTIDKIDPEKIIAVNGAGVDLDAFQQEPLNRITPLTFLFVGRLEEKKGFEDYCEAVSIVKKKYPGMIFNAIGGVSLWHERSFTEYQNKAKKAGIHYFGEVLDVKPYLRDAHVIVFPSHGEATSKALLEALAIGRPLVTTNVSGCAESVTPKENGVMVHVKDPWAIANAMTYFIEHSYELQSMAKASRHLAETNFNADHVNKRIVDSIVRF